MEKLLMIIIAGVIGGAIYWLSEKWHEWLKKKK